MSGQPRETNHPKPGGKGIPAGWPRRAKHDADCPVCLGPHDEEIHAATLSVRLWFRDEIMRRLASSPAA